MVQSETIGVGDFLRIDARALSDWLMRRHSRLVWYCMFVIVAGAAPYGAVVGCWWSPLQALYVAIKMPALILLTSLGNGLLNGMLALLLGLNIGFRQSLTAVLVSFAYAAAVLGALCPVALFVVCNTPPLMASTKPSSADYAVLQLALVAFIALAGVIGNVRLLPLLRQLAGNRSVARNVLSAWLAGNLLLGSQICWVLRPFVWDPGRPVTFVSRESLNGSFFESVFEAVKRLLN